MEYCERRAHFVRSVRNELAKLANRRIDALQELIEGLRQAAELVVRRSDGQRLPEPLAVGHTLSHEFGMLGKRLDGRQAFPDVEGRDRRRDQQAKRKEQQSNATKGIQ